MKDKLDLIDHYLTTISRKGFVFTRQARSGLRIDQARLDWGYSSNRGSWHSFVCVLEHDNRETLSDHIPIVIEL